MHAPNPPGLPQNGAEGWQLVAERQGSIVVEGTISGATVLLASMEPKLLTSHQLVCSAAQW